MQLVAIWMLGVLLQGEAAASGEDKAAPAKNLERIKTDVRRVGENMENLAFDLVGQLMDAADLFNGDNGEARKDVAKETTTDAAFETTENTLEESPTFSTNPVSYLPSKTKKPKQLTLHRNKRSVNQFQNQILESNLIHENSQELIDHQMELPRQNELYPEFQRAAKNTGPEMISPQLNSKTCSPKTQEEIKLENLRIKEINEEIKKLNELVVLLRDQQKIMDLLGNGKTTNDITERFGSSGLLKVLDKLNSHDMQEPKTTDQHNIPSREMKTTHQELEDIKKELRNTISTLSRTKIILTMEREKEIALENELKIQKQELTSLKSTIEKLLAQNSTTDKNIEKDIVGAFLPKMLPLVPPQHKNGTLIGKENSDGRASRSNSRTSELQRLIRMLEENEEEKKSKNDILEEKIKELEKKMESQSKSDDTKLDSSQLMKRLILSRLLTGQGSNSGSDADLLPKKLTDALESRKDPAQKRIDELNELRALEAAIQSLRPKDQLDIDGFGGKQDEAQFQAMLTKLIQQGGGTNSGTNTLSPPLKNQMGQFGALEDHNGFESQIPGLKLTPQQIIALKSPTGQYGNNDIGYRLPGVVEGLDVLNNNYYQGNSYIPSKLSPYPLLPYQPIPNIPYKTQGYPQTYVPFIPSYGPTSNQNYPYPSEYNPRIYKKDITSIYNPYTSFSPPNYGNAPTQYGAAPNNYAGYQNLYRPNNIPPGYAPPNTRTRPYSTNASPYPQSNNQVVDYNQNQFFRLPQPSGDYSQPEPNSPYGSKNDGRPGYDQQGYNSQGPQLVPEQYKYQKIEDLRNQVYHLENVISNLNRPEYVQKPEDKVNIAHLEQKIGDLKGVISSLSQQSYYGNDAQPQTQSYAPNPLPPPPPPPLAPSPSQVPPAYSPQDQNQSAPQQNQNYEGNKSRTRRSTEDNKVNDDTQLLNHIGTFFTKYIDTNDSNDFQRSNTYDDVKQRIENLKKQLGPYTPPPNGFQRTSYNLPNYNSFSPYQNYPNINNYQSFPVTKKIDALETKKQDIFTSIIIKILDKVIAATPAVLERLFGYGITQLTYSYGDSYSEIQNLLKNLGFLGYFPLIIVKLVEGLSTFLNILKKNPTVRNFLVPVLILALVAGAIIFLIWWLLPDYSKSPYQIGYENSDSYNYNERNMYNDRKSERNSKLRNSYPSNNPIFEPYSRTYLENGQNWIR